MLILSYCCRTSHVDLPILRNPLSEYPPSAIESTNRLVKEVQGPVPVEKKKRGTYQKMTNEQQTTVSKYAAEHIITTTVYHVSKDYEKPLCESTVCGLKEKKLVVLQRKHKAVDVRDKFCMPSSARHLTHARV